MLTEQPHLDDDVRDWLLDREAMPRLLRAIGEERLDHPSVVLAATP